MRSISDRVGRRSSKRLWGAVAGVVTLWVLWAPAAEAQSLRGSHASLIRQRQWARNHNFSYLRTPSDVNRFVRKGLLVPLRGNRDYAVEGVSFPYVRSEVRTFVERLSTQYRQGCGEKLVVTSATRPVTRQPRNASRLSVHPTGMAIDLRRSRSGRCRSWLERVFLTLESQGVLEATRESYPPHYHVAVFPEPYSRYVAKLEGESASPAGPVLEAAAQVSERTYRVRRGDSLWSIAERTGVTVRLLKEVNDMPSSRIHPGQKLLIPSTG